MEATNYSFIGSGVTHVRPRGSAEGFRDIGNATALSIAVEEEQQTLRNYRGGGGNYDAARRVSGVTLSITMSDFSPENLELALRGTVTEVSSGSVTGEEHTAYIGALVPLDNLPDISDPETITVTQDPGGTAVELVRGTDYELTRSGIKILEGGTVADEDTIGVDYTKRKSAIIHALMESAKDLELYFAGLNDAQNGLPVEPHLKRVRLGVPEELALLGDDYGALSITGDVLHDDQAEAGTSPFFDINMARK